MVSGNKLIGFFIVSVAFRLLCLKCFSFTSTFLVTWWPLFYPSMVTMNYIAIYTLCTFIIFLHFRIFLRKLKVQCDIFSLCGNIDLFEKEVQKYLITTILV